MKMMDKAEKCLDPQLWHACAGGLVQIPPLNSKVFYFPQGHAEHSNGPVCFMASPNIIPSFILCKLTAVNYMADRYTDEVFARITLVPLKADDFDLDDDWPKMAHQNHEKAAKSSFAKTLTQSDANNGGGFSVPRYCAETIFPGLDYSSKPPVQTIVAKDVHGESWKFRHIYRGTPRRHLLTTGWSNFVNQKKLMAGDSIVFMRAENGELCIGIRRAKLGGFGGGPEFGVGQGLKGFDDADGARKVVPESVAQAAALAAIGRQFEVVYYPRASAPEFVVSAYSLSHSMKVQWSSGMRFKMPFETEDSSRISWFMGTISLVQVADPIRWPDSPWRLLQVLHHTLNRTLENNAYQA
ncbi:hypothetical protein SAY86_004945 [Trapa natans]|uniref:Auxin response factor n=1 Tax=Trapa natans TaxID=22666 RepID=A0AAN7L876_TRANT|nr:hypothetical protein SAY86_004945 [Trapa natans]